MILITFRLLNAAEKFFESLLAAKTYFVKFFFIDTLKISVLLRKDQKQSLTYKRERVAVKVCRHAVAFNSQPCTFIYEQHDKVKESKLIDKFKIWNYNCVISMFKYGWRTFFFWKVLKQYERVIICIWCYAEYNLYYL